MRSFDVDESTWKEAQNKIQTTKYSNLSEALRDKIRNIAEISDIKDSSGNTIIEIGNFTNKMEKSIILLFNKSISKEPVKRISTMIKNNGIYSRRNHIKSVLERISNSEILPFELENGYLISKELKCSCGSSFFPKAISKNDGYCPSCGKQIIDLSEETMEYEVV